MKIKKSNNISIFMSKDNANSGSEDKAQTVKQCDLSKSHTNYTTLENIFQSIFKIYILNHKACKQMF